MRRGSSLVRPRSVPEAWEVGRSNLRGTCPRRTRRSTAATVIADVVDKYDNDLIDLRRDLHAHPELSWSELRTAEVVAGAGRAGRLAGDAATAAPASPPTSATSGPLVALRADMDALPVQDLTDDPWASTVAGVAHACGHDVHTTALVGAALALAELHDRGLLPGRVRLLFQPAEEVMPGGAVHLMEEGALDGRRAGLRAALRPRRRRRPGRAPARAAHQRRRPGRGPAHRHRRPHQPTAPDRRPHLRAGQGDHRAAGGAEPPDGPAGRRQRGVGEPARRLGAQRDPRPRRGHRHRPDPRRRGLGRLRGGGPRRSSTRSSGPTA